MTPSPAPLRSRSVSALHTLRQRRAGIACAFSLCALTVLTACKRQHYPVEQVAELGYPTCPPDAQGPTETQTEQSMRSGSNDPRETIVEHYRIEKRGCHHVVTVRQEWSKQAADVEVIYDEGMLPLRAWVRLTAPSSTRPDGQAEFKRYELRTPEVTVKRRDATGNVEFEELRFDEKPAALIGPGRGMISMWLKRAKLEPGQKTREPALDFRGVEKIAPVTLARLPDQHVETLGRTARVYTFLGRETVFADENDNVIGDLAGLVTADRATSPAPPPMPTFQRLDPSSTP